VVGKTISHYQVLEKLGEGGMGVVYKAKDTHLDRFAAIKLLPAERVADPERKRRFIQEAKAASALNHPNIIVIYAIESENGCCGRGGNQLGSVGRCGRHVVAQERSLGTGEVREPLRHAVPRWFSAFEDLRHVSTTGKTLK
jgi:serine/threonine protein kinase